MWKEFKAFALRGNVLDMAVGVIIGASFGKIVTSLVEDIIMPPIGLLLGHVDFSSLFISLTGVPFDSIAAAKAAGAPTLNYGLFINAVLNFFIVTLAVYFMVRAVNKLQPPKPVTMVEMKTKPCPFCATAIPEPAKKCPHCTADL
ncbi:MAG: large conductance mechanosensitive channel protein MscL [Myxococcales bacterium]|nr:large conductance mechanosensitive channel protein MscL [Myxococcales bacterium]